MQSFEKLFSIFDSVSVPRKKGRQMLCKTYVSSITMTLTMVTMVVKIRKPRSGKNFTKQLFITHAKPSVRRCHIP